jgi:hypothetical protein
LLEIPLQAEGSIVQEGWLKQVQRQEEQDYNQDAVDNLKLVLSNNIQNNNNNINDNTGNSNSNSSLLPPPIWTQQGRWWEIWITSEIQQQTQQLQRRQRRQRHQLSPNQDIMMDDQDSRIEDLEGTDETASHDGNYDDNTLRTLQRWCRLHWYTHQDAAWKEMMLFNSSTTFGVGTTNTTADRWDGSQFFLDRSIC